MDQATYEFNGYTIKAPRGGSIFKAVEGDRTVMILKESGVYATLQYVNGGLNVVAEHGVRIEGNNINVL
ncbi:hypothetical protein [Halobacillus campisalis]|uniref:Uncharacterized protein n=1 Tax=Halobacillus campisalis TaxID=435909 RepID=A0ABW2JZE1_9BACI|nr:hypothetical protein [Halobacillus campisalis]